MNDNSKVFAGIIAGLAAGAAIALLLAPEKGEDLRNRISDGVQGANDDLKDTFAGLRSRVEDTLKSIEEDIRNLVSDQKDAVSETASALKTKKEAVSRKARELGEEIVA